MYLQNLNEITQRHHYRIIRVADKNCGINEQSNYR